MKHHFFSIEKLAHQRYDKSVSFVFSFIPRLIDGDKDESYDHTKQEYTIFFRVLRQSDAESYDDYDDADNNNRIEIFFNESYPVYSCPLFSDVMPFFHIFFVFIIISFFFRKSMLAIISTSLKFCEEKSYKRPRGFLAAARNDNLILFFPLLPSLSLLYRVCIAASL